MTQSDCIQHVHMLDDQLLELGGPRLGYGIG